MDFIYLWASDLFLVMYLICSPHGCFPELLNLTGFLTAPDDGLREVVWWKGKPIDHWAWSADYKWVCWSNLCLCGVKLSFLWFQWIKWFFTLIIDFKLGQRMLTRFLWRFLVWVISRELVLMHFFYYHDNYRVWLSQ